MESQQQIKLDIGKTINSDIFDFKPTFRPGEKIAQQFEAEILKFADHFLNTPSICSPMAN